MEPDKKKSGRGGFALLAGLGKAKSDKGSDDAMGKDDGLGTSDMSDSGMDMDKATMAADDLAESMGLPEDKRDAFAEAFKAAVKACMDDSGSDEGESKASGLAGLFGSK